MATTHFTAKSVRSTATSPTDSGPWTTALTMYNVKDYGATGDGATNDTTAINAAITAANAAGGGTVIFPTGTYLCLSLALKSKVRLLGDRGAVLRKNAGGTATSIIECSGTLGTAVNLSANAAANASSVTATTNPASLAAGDYVLIRDATYKYSTTGRNQELNKIASVSGSFTFNLTHRTKASYATASTAEIIKLTPIVDARVEGLTLELATGTDGGCIYNDLCYGFVVKDCLLKGARQYYTWNILRTAYSKFLFNEVRDNQNDDVDTGLAVVIGESSHNIDVIGNTFTNYNQNAFSNNARDCNFWLNECVGSTQDSVNTHGTGCERIDISHNIITNAGQFGMSVSGSDHATDRDVTVSGNVFSNSVASAISAGAAVTMEIKNLIISGNTIRTWNTGNGGNEFGIIAAFCDDVQITGNNLDGGGLSVAQTGIRVQDCNDVNVVGNVIGNMTGSATGISHYQTDGITIAVNQLSDINGDNIASLGGTMARCVVRNNQADDTSRTQGSGERWENNLWGTSFEYNSGVISKANTNTISHGLITTPTRYGITSTVAGHIASITAVSSTTITVGLTDAAGTGIAVAENVAWWAAI